MIASVIVNILNKQLNREFYYLVPMEYETVIKVGFRVKVEFSRRIITAIVVKLVDDSAYNGKLKPLISLVDSYPVLNEELVDISYYIAEENFSYYSLALDMMIPQALKVKVKRIANVLIPEKNEFKSLTRKGRISLDGLNEENLKKIYQGIGDGIYSLDTEIKKNRNEKVEKYIYSNFEYCGALTFKETNLLKYLEEIGKTSYEVFIETSGFSKNMTNNLIKTGAILVETKEILDYKYETTVEDKKVVLNQLQNNTINSVILNEECTYLLHGVTGSGKTEVYMNLIQKVIDSGKNAIMLVPEISLTPQINALFLARFKSNIAIMHSRVSVKDKYIAWRRIINKEVKIVVGARSAIFSPLENIGIIIIDEEHESSYKQDNNPKYDAIEIAKLRSKTYKCPLILGSATPNVCDYYYAINGNYKLLTLNTRVNNQSLPQSYIVDMRKELMEGNKSVFSRTLKEKLVTNYENKRQSILFLNRRGYSTFVMCRECGEAVKCPHCDVTLTYHNRYNTLACHHCGYSMPNVVKCDNCGSSKIKFVGSGTEKLEEEVKVIIPSARVLRMDYDTTRTKDSYIEAYDKVSKNEIDILIGTQMITKGLDFENVTLIGVVNADLALKYPEYDASMQAFNLIEQVSGRAGRKNLKGEVVIQTYDPDNFVINCAKNHDYDSFFKREINRRELTLMPPFSSYIKLIVSSKDKEIALAEANTIIKFLKKSNEGNSIILGPVKEYIFKLRDEFRFRIEIQATSDEVLNQIRYIYPLYQNNKKVNVSITRM